jgi:hypothetical protein
MGLFDRLKALPQSILAVVCFFAIQSCNKEVPDRIVAYSNDFETAEKQGFTIYGANGIEDSTKIFNFNGSKVFGRFNSNAVVFQNNQLPKHNVIKIEFDLFIHDDWRGNFITPGAAVPDLWQLKLDNNPILVTSFSNGTNDQSFPTSYYPTVYNNKAYSNSWATYPGVCSKAGQNNGTSFYKIEYITSHEGPIELVFQDVLVTASNLCIKSWSIDNLKLTTTLKQ